MIFKRSLSQRLLGCSVAALLAIGVPALRAAPADNTAAKKAETKKTETKKPDPKKAAKADPKKADPKKPAAKTTAKPDPKAAKKDAKAPAKRDIKKEVKKDAKPAPKVAAAPAKFTPASASSTHAPAPTSALKLPAQASLSPAQILPSSFTPGPPTAPVGAMADAPVLTAAPAAPTRMAARAPVAPFIAAETTVTPASDAALVEQAVTAVRKGRLSEASGYQKSMNDPLARKLTEWMILRNDDSTAGFERYAGFSGENPSWPNTTLFRRRAEGALWDERRDDQTVRSFFHTSKPITAKGKFALARVLLNSGDRGGAAALAREAWREDVCSAEVERVALDTFGELLTRADHKARMDRHLYDGDSEVGTRAAARLGGTELAIAKARQAVNDKSSNARALLEAVPSSARGDAGYIFSKAQWLRRDDRAAEAAHLILSVPRVSGSTHDLEEWWNERRLVARKLLDDGEHQLAYKVAREAVPPTKENPRAEHEFTAGWIALRFANNPRAAYEHFSRVGQGTTNPITLARGEYWMGRAAEALGHNGEARGHYQAAAQYPTAYYGQIARAKLGMGELNLRRPPEPGRAMMNLEVVRAVNLLYQADARDLVVPFVSDLADRAVDPAALVAIAEVARKNDDARAMLLIGKAALRRNVAFELYAFPTNGIPRFNIVGPPVDKSVVYAIARQESAFNPRAISSAKALGLMQVLPGTGKLIAKKFGFPFSQDRMLSDPAYNAQMGAAELGDVLESYRGSYILSFVAYNAGRGRVKQWIERYGDPRDPNVDPIDWVERIPFSETRNYVQRVLENMQVYRTQLGGGSRLMIEADLRRGSTAN